MEPIVEKNVGTDSLYQRDFYAWTQEQVQFLKQGNMSRLDVKNLIEELKDMGRGEFRSMESAVKQALLHFIKLGYSASEDPRAGWNVSVVKQRDVIENLLAVNPSLKPKLEESFVEVWPSARKIAMAELAADNEMPSIPAECPFSLDEMLDESFLPLPNVATSKPGV